MTASIFSNAQVLFSRAVQWFVCIELDVDRFTTMDSVLFFKLYQFCLLNPVLTNLVTLIPSYLINVITLSVSNLKPAICITLSKINI